MATKIHSIGRNNTAIIIQARLGSTRLPGKVLLPLGDSTVLEFMIERLNHAGFPIYLALADEKDKRLEQLASKLIEEKQIAGACVGSIDNVCGRTIKCAEMFEVEHIIDITSDCPFADPELVEDMFKYYQAGDWHYVSNIGTRTFADGFDIQIYSTKTLKTVPVSKKEHSGWNILQDEFMEKFNYTAPFDSYAPELRITLDTIQDYSIISRVYGYFSEKFQVNSLYNIFHRQPTYQEITRYLKERL